MPALPQNCYKTPHGYQFRLVIPEPLRALIGKREIKKTLGKDYQQAVSQSRLLAVQVDRQLAEARARLDEAMAHQDALEAFLAKPVDQRLKPITEVTPELTEGLKSLWLSSLAADLDWRRQGLDDDAYDDLQANIEQTQTALARALARGQPEPFIPAVRGLLHGRGYDLLLTDEAERQLVLDLLPAIQHGYDILAQRQQGRLVDAPAPTTPPLPAAWELASPTDHASAWQTLYDHWKADRTRSLRTEVETQTYIEHIQTLLPKVAPDQFTRAHVTQWLRHERDSRGNSPGTLEKKGTLVGAVFSVAVKDELLSLNPFAGFDYQRFASKSGIADPDEREPFTLDHLKTIFSPTSLFSVQKRSGGGGYHARVWMPLIALYTGARLDEIGRLTVADIQTDPVPHFWVLRGKTQSSLREVPLHPQLIELGLLDYVDGLRAAGQPSLWPELRTKAKVAEPSEILGKWFNRYIHQTLKLPSQVVFHSFRHTFKDLCRNAGIPRDVHEALTGHAKTSVGDDYGKGYSVEFKRQELSKIVLGFEIPKPLPYEAHPARRIAGRSRTQ